MDSKATVCFLLVLLCGCQVSSGSIISETVVALEKALQSYINTTLVTAHTIAASVENGVIKGIREAEETISSMIHRALNIASSVRECSAQARKELANIRTSSEKELRDCISPSSQGINSAVDEFGNDLQDINHSIVTSFSNFTSCGFNFGCDIHSLLEANAKNSEIRFNIANHVLDLQRAALVAQRNGTQCVQKVTSSTSLEITAVAGQAIACVSSPSSTEQTSNAP